MTDAYTGEQSLSRTRRQALSESHPNHAAMAHGWDPSLVTAGSNLTLQWSCQDGHVFAATVANFCRPKKSLLCHVCSGRKLLKGFNDLKTLYPDLATQANGWDPTDFLAGSNKRMSWKCASGHIWEVKIASRVTFGSKCPQCSHKKIIVGKTDLQTKYPSLARQAYGWDPSKVMPGTHKKLLWKCELGHVWEAACNSRVKGSGCPFCGGYFPIPGENDLATLFPEIASQADGWDPTQVGPSAQKRMPWKCSLGHKWSSVVGSRTVKKSQNASCPVCSGQRVLVGFNDLLTKYPVLAAEADGWDPAQITVGSGKKLGWVCSEGHRWEAQVVSRVSGNGCPICAVYGFKLDREAWLYLLQDQARGIMKIGITNYPKDRVGLHERRGFQLKDLEGPLPGTFAKEWEQKILTALAMHQVNFAEHGELGKFDGYTESWYSASLHVDSIEQLLTELRLDSDLSALKKKAGE